MVPEKMATPVALQFLAGSAPVASTSGGAPTTICSMRAAAFVNSACSDAVVAFPKNRRSILYADWVGLAGPEESLHAPTRPTPANASNRPRRRIYGASL